MSDRKCVLIIDEDLPVGVVANTAAVLAVSIGKFCPDIVGRDLFDCAGDVRRGITTMALPTLKGSGELLRDMRGKLKEYEPDLVVIDLVGATRVTKSYEEYAEALAETPEEELQYQGIALYGDKRIVNKFSGNLPLLR
ncbi:DUF2000 family protein [Microbulbifer sp. SH-1]|uniref:DUF2000 domain-containing protein n=1 Tax=Microbulbifer sp. SH-1 TaxID=2681547 RepID=UPI001409625E|nr:DUF2000 domain-containing protein [Microbulbifer sp. SH-1]QIL91023.1 DUF2000 family protein [Microbulbifer sp. SH-1]